jgi:hypothetical protein
MAQSKVARCFSCFKKSGVYYIIQMLTPQKEYYLNLVADKIYINPV